MTYNDETQRLKSLLADLDARFEAWPRHSAGPMNGTWAALVEQRGYLRGAITNREARHI